MEEKLTQIKINGNAVKALVQAFTEDDRFILKNTYQMWIGLCKIAKKLKWRYINFPEGLSESLFCLEFESVRVVKVAGKESGSFDTYNLKMCRREQVKASSAEEDLTSFGPASVWDDLYFLDFHRMDWTFDVYQIPNDLVYNQKVNKNQTFKDQQKQKRRPRFSIKKEIILRNRIKPIKTCRI